MYEADGTSTKHRYIRLATGRVGPMKLNFIDTRQMAAYAKPEKSRAELRTDEILGICFKQMCPEFEVLKLS